MPEDKSIAARVKALEEAVAGLTERVVALEGAIPPDLSGIEDRLALIETWKLTVHQNVGGYVSPY